MAALGIFSKIFFKKHKSHNLIKKNSYIDNNNNNKKIRKYIKFTIFFYEFSYFEIVA